MRTKNKKIINELKTPIDKDSLLEEAMIRWREKDYKPGLYKELIDKEIDRKILLLIEDLGLRSNATAREIILELAKKIYTGFCFVNETPKKGAKSKWSEFVLTRLYFEVQRHLLENEGKATIKSILDEMLYSPFWKKMLNLNDDPVGEHRISTIKRITRQYYYAEKLPIVQMYKEMDVGRQKAFVLEVLEDLKQVLM